MTAGSVHTEWSADGLHGLVDVLRRVPDEYRTFYPTRDDAIRIYRVPEKLLDELVDLGMPCQRAGKRLIFDADDLANVTLRVGLDTPQRRSLVQAARAIERSGEEPQSFTVDIMGRCPDPGHAGPCHFVVDTGLAEVANVESAESIAPNHTRLRLRLPGRAPNHLPKSPETESLLTSIEDVQFHRLPPRLSGDIGFMRETKLADCRLASFFLADWGSRIGLPVRLAFGVLVSPPLSTPHWWIEVQVEGEWTGADPFFLTALARWGVVDGEKWPPTRTTPSIYWVRANQGMPLVTHGGTRLRPSLMTRMTNH